MLLLVPAVAMQFTNEVRWTASDFLFAAGLIAALGGALELVVRRGGSVAYKASAAVALLAVFALVWINGAVGIIGQEGDAAGWLFVGVIALSMGGGGVYALPRPALSTQGSLLAGRSTHARQRSNLQLNIE